MKQTTTSILSILFYLIVWPVHGLLCTILEWIEAVIEISWQLIKGYADHMRIGWHLLIKHSKEEG